MGLLAVSVGLVGFAHAGPPDATVAELRAELAAKDVEIARLRTALDERMKADRAVVAFSDVSSRRRNDNAAPSSTLTHASGEKLAQMFSCFTPGASFNTVRPTGSMKPLFDEKAVLLTEPAAFADLKTGDIVIYQHPQSGALIVHRLVLKEGNKFWVKGDANSRMDNTYVTAENFQRRVYGVLYTRGTN